MFYNNKNLWQFILSFTLKKASIRELIFEKLNSTFRTNLGLNSNLIKNIKLFKTQVFQVL